MTESADTFSFDNGAGVTGVITGGSGTNLLNYSQYTTGIYANLQTATANGTTNYDTNYDTNVTALDTLLATWDKTSLTYAHRQAALLTGVSYFSGQTASLVIDFTVHASPGPNPSTLTGGSGQDLFFATVSDTIKNKSGKTVYYF